MQFEAYKYFYVATLEFELAELNLSGWREGDRMVVITLQTNNHSVIT